MKKKSVVNFMQRFLKIKKSPQTILLACAITLMALILGYILLGVLPMILFAFGFVGGLILWLIIPTRVSFSSIKVPYFATMALFIVHKLEERYLNFFPALSEITGVPVPEADSWLVYLLYATAAAWLLIPYLVSRKYQFGYYLAWTFFTSMGVTELAHFFLPFFTGRSYGYFPGMASVVLLAPLGWWGLLRLSRKDI